MASFLLDWTSSDSDLAFDRYDVRRHLVLTEANAIATSYLRAQLLGETHRSRISNLLVQYTDNRIVLARATDGDVEKHLVENDRMLTELWAATAAAFDSIKNIDFSSSFVETMNNLIELDAARKVSRLATVPTAILVILSVYIIVTGGMMGYVLVGVRGQVAGAFFITLLTFVLALIIDMERPTRGAIVESQVPMERLRMSLETWPPEVFDRWRSTESQGSLSKAP